MNMKTHPANIKPSRAGHSIGRWEGDTLVVDSVGFSPGVLNAPVRNSDLKGQYAGRDCKELKDVNYSQQQSGTKR